MDERHDGLNPPAQSLPHVLDALLRELTESADLAAAAVHLRDGGALMVRRNNRGASSEWRGDGRIPPDDLLRGADRRGRAVAAPVRPTPVGAVLPLSYAGEPIGELRLGWRRASDRKRAKLARLQSFADQCAAVVKRYHVQAWAAQRLGGPLLLIGLSRALREVEGQLERAAGCSLPVLLSGEFGTEKPQFAAAIHFGGPRRDGPFVQVNCAEPAGLPSQWFEKARGGSLFFNGVDELPLNLQNQLPLHMPSGLGQWLPMSVSPDVRLIASTTRDLRAFTEDGGFSRKLLAELDVLSIRVPPLRERSSDIGVLAAAALRRRGFEVEEKHSDAFIAALQAYSWPENLSELERVVVRLAVMTDEGPIMKEDILRHAPWIARAPAPAAGEPSPPAHPDAEGLDRWALAALAGDEASLSELHPALRKALLFLGEKYADPLSIPYLARQAHVSESHLSFLFRSALETSFKRLLLRIRILKAMELLASEGRRQVTDVAMSVGFADLSHFEKSFRRIAGRSPREYRRAYHGNGHGNGNGNGAV